MKRILYTIQMATELPDDEYDSLIANLNNDQWDSDEINEIVFQLYLNGYIDGSFEFLAENNDGLNSDIELV